MFYVVTSKGRTRYPLTWEGADQAVTDAAALFMVPRCMRWMLWAYLPATCLLVGASIGRLIYQ